MIYNVSSGTLNTTTPYHRRPIRAADRPTVKSLWVGASGLFAPRWADDILITKLSWGVRFLAQNAQGTIWPPGPRLRLRTSNCSLLFMYLPQKDERLSRPGWLTYSGRFTHITGHPPALGRAQDRNVLPLYHATRVGPGAGRSKRRRKGGDGKEKWVGEERKEGGWWREEERERGKLHPRQ